MKLYCGVDLHSNNGVYVVIDENDKKLLHRRLPNDLDTVLDHLGPYREDLDCVAVESTFNWYWLVDGLMDCGYPVKLANPAAIEQYDGLKDANDDTDAFHLALLCRLGILPTGYIYPREQRSLRDLLRRRLLFVNQRTAQILSVQNLLSRVTGRRWGWRSLQRLDPQEMAEVVGDEFHAFTAGQQMHAIRMLSEKIKLLNARAMESMSGVSTYEQLLTIPGTGTILGTTITLETGEIDRFPKAGNFTSYCRASKAKHTSNGKVKKTNNRKNGNKYLSWAFTEAAHHLIRNCDPARRFYQKKKARKNGAVATKALASKLSKAAYYIMKNGTAFDVKRMFG